MPSEQNKYYIFNIQQNVYLYVSNSKSGVLKYRNNNVLASTGEPGTGAQAEKYVFEFEDNNGDGFYQIKNQGKYVYVSRQRNGIPSNRLVKAATSQNLRRSETQFFQLTLREVRASYLIIIGKYLHYQPFHLCFLPCLYL